MLHLRGSQSDIIGRRGDVTNVVRVGWRRDSGDEGGRVVSEVRRTGAQIRNAADSTMGVIGCDLFCQGNAVAVCRALGGEPPIGKDSDGFLSRSCRNRFCSLIAVVGNLSLGDDLSGAVRMGDIPPTKPVGGDEGLRYE